MNKKVHIPLDPTLGLIVLGITTGGIVWAAGNQELAGWIWATTTLGALASLASSILRQLLHGEVGVDVIALIAMAGALLLNQYLAGAVVALMLSGGQALESYADRRAKRELSALIQRAPQQVQKYAGDALVFAKIEEVEPGDLLLVKPGEVVPVDGSNNSPVAVLDESALSGESRLSEKRKGELVQSGTVNAGGPFDLRATARAEESTYAGIVRLVREALASKAPFVRMADRYALIFLPITVLAAAAAWVVSGDPIRALSVLVVATPCPLILAAPVAIVSGISRAARHGVIIKGGGALEALSEARILLLDKTGTLTEGTPRLAQIETFDSHDPQELLRLAASLDQVSSHVLATAIVKAAAERELKLSFPTNVVEHPGIGIRGHVDEKLVSLGKSDWVFNGQALPQSARKIRRQSTMEGATCVFVAVNGVPNGALIFVDSLRPESARTIRSLRRSGIGSVIVVTGDHTDIADIIGAAVGADQVLSERTPEDKVEVVRVAARSGKTIMVGDGINDAPALAAAHVGVAMGARGATISSQAADVVLMVDRLDHLAEALRIAHRARGIALQSVLAGMGLSFGGMVLAGAGLLMPLSGALFQELIDVAVILNALRALKDPTPPVITPPAGLKTGEKIREEHKKLLPELRRLRELADHLDELPPAEARRHLLSVKQFLTEQLIPHEKVEDETMYPVIAELMGGDDPTGTMSRAHLEISRLIRSYGHLVDLVSTTDLDSEDIRDFRRMLYGLHALLTLHFAQEEEHYLSLIQERFTPGEGSRAINLGDSN